MKRFYWENPEVFETEVELVQIDGSVCKILPVVFHPDEGGQPPDMGFVSDAKILKIEVKDGEVLLTLDKPLQSGKYIAKIDSKHRLAQSRRHTAQHVISGVAEHEMNLATTGVRIAESCTIDFDKKIEWEQAIQLEKLSNEAIMQDLPVLTEYGTLTDRGRFGDELSDKDSSELRVVVIGNIDRSACCGTHVTSTGKIGSVRIISLEASRQGSRITFVAGIDAINSGIAESTVLRNLRKTASCSNDELMGSFAKLQEQSSQLSKDNAVLWEKLIPFELDKAVSIESKDYPSNVLFTAAPVKLLPKIASMLQSRSNSNALVVSESGMLMVVSSSKGQAKMIQNLFLTKFQLKGGGSESSVNLLFTNPINIDDIKSVLI
jgi:alanyl-tRNA synthetase